MENCRSASVSSFLFIALVLWFSSLFTCCSSSVVHYHKFVVQATPVKRQCKTVNVITVNGQYPGPTLEVRNGDSLVVEVINHAQYNVTIHWHGIRQMRTGWADGPEYITQCPIRPDGSYTYRFTIEDQEGTLWWHAHSSWLRATVHGALIIYPREGSVYPFPKPHQEFPVILGEWWNRDPISVVRQAMITGATPNISDAFTINGQLGDLYKCSSKDTTTVFPVKFGETNLLRFINAAMSNELFVSIAGHSMTVVAADAVYTKPFTTSVLMLGPGQTTDVLVTANQPAGRYYMAARAYASAQGVPFDNTTATAILKYSSCPSMKGQQGLHPAFPILPAYNDTATAYAFSSSIKSPMPVKIPGPVDYHLFFAVGLGLFNCPPGRICGGPNNTMMAASMNNVSFQLPTTVSILQAYQLGVKGVYTTDFPAAPPVKFDYTAPNISRALYQPVKGTKVYPIKYGSVVQVVLQGTNIVAGEEHPMHIHGYHFYVLATGFGNYDPIRDAEKFNLVDPPQRNTVGVPVNGWAVIRFVADNPGVWLVHCHLDVHITWGLATAFLVENGVGKLETLEPPPADLPVC